MVTQETQREHSEKEKNLDLQPASVIKMQSLLTKARGTNKSPE